MIVTDPERLRVKCDDVKPEEVSELISKLEEGLAYSERVGRPGIGLAAPQIGIAKHIAIVRIPLKTETLKLNLVNAKIIEQNNLKPFKDEGCLSFPDVTVDTMRYEDIVLTTDVYPFKCSVSGLIAVAVQHELEHLNKILLTDHIK